jgi:hypothetical protein
MNSIGAYALLLSCSSVAPWSFGQTTGRWSGYWSVVSLCQVPLCKNNRTYSGVASPSNYHPEPEPLVLGFILSIACMTHHQSS